MLKEVLVTEENYLEIIEELNKLCKVWKFMLLRWFVGADGSRSVVEQSWGKRLEESTEDCSSENMRSRKVAIVGEHVFRTRYLMEKDKEPEDRSLVYDMYMKHKPLISIEASVEFETIVVAGSIIKFTDFGFITYNRNKDGSMIEDWFIIAKPQKITEEEYKRAVEDLEREKEEVFERLLVEWGYSYEEEEN